MSASTSTLAHREIFFRCTFSPASGRGGRVGHVVAWDAREAVQLFAAVLREEGVARPGTIEVAPLRDGRTVRRAPYRPRAMH